MTTSTLRNVSIAQGHLHIGGDSYPLRNVARTSVWTFTVSPPPTPGWATGCAVVGGIAAFFTLISTFASFGSGDGGWITTNLVWLGIWSVVLFLGVRRLMKPKESDLHLTALDITTSGTPQTALVSDNYDALIKLRDMMTAAINDLSVVYNAELNTYHVNAQNYAHQVQSGGTGFTQTN